MRKMKRFFSALKTKYFCVQCCEGTVLRLCASKLILSVSPTKKLQYVIIGVASEPNPWTLEGEREGSKGSSKRRSAERVRGGGQRGCWCMVTGIVSQPWCLESVPATGGQSLALWLNSFMYPRKSFECDMVSNKWKFRSREGGSFSNPTQKKGKNIAMGGRTKVTLAGVKVTLSSGKRNYAVAFKRQKNLISTRGRKNNSLDYLVYIKKRKIHLNRK